MAQAAFWKGYLKLSLVTCPVALTPATTESEKVRFHTINRKDEAAGARPATSIPVTANPSTMRRN